MEVLILDNEADGFAPASSCDELRRAGWITHSINSLTIGVRTLGG